MRGQRHAPAAFYLRERPGTHCTGGWVGPRAGLDGGKSRRTGIRYPDHPPRSQSLYPAHHCLLLLTLFALVRNYSVGQLTIKQEVSVTLVRT
jgi:hypothetical protein